MTSLGEDDFLNDLLKEVEVQKELNWTHKSFIKPLKDLREDKGVVLQVPSLQFTISCVLSNRTKIEIQGIMELSLWTLWTYCFMLCSAKMYMNWKEPV